MSSEVQPVLKGYATLAPQIATRDTASEIEFLTAAFDSDELGRMHNEDCSNVHFGSIWWLSEHIEDVEPELQVQRWADPEYIESVCTGEPRPGTQQAPRERLGAVRTWYDEHGSGDPLVLMHGAQLPS